MGGRQSKVILKWKYKSQQHVIVVPGEEDAEKGLGVFLADLQKGQVKEIVSVDVNDVARVYIHTHYTAILSALRNHQSPAPVGIKPAALESMQLMDSDIHDLITAMHSKQIRLGLAELTPANYQQAVKLCLTPKQIQHVGTVEEAIAEAYFQRSYRLLVITPQSDNNYVIGFIMYDPVSPLTAPLNNVAIHKFLIGCDYQGRGYGEEAMRLFINKARFVNPRATIVELRTDTDNAAAIKVYKKVGFLMEPGDEPGVLAGIYLLK